MLNDSDSSFLCEQMLNRVMELHGARMDEAEERMRPFLLLAPHVRVYQDGDQWCALYGETVQSGVVGFGPTPETAAQAFDRAWKGV